MNEDKCQEKARKPSILSLMKKNFLELRVLNVEKKAKEKRLKTKTDLILPQN
jgi:hypothetical protein